MGLRYPCFTDNQAAPWMLHSRSTEAKKRSGC
jgi:hypothetical protein